MLLIIVIIAGFMASAFVEYALHRFFLHREGNIHLLEHHKNFKPQQGTFTVETFELDEVFSGFLYLLLNILLYLPFAVIISNYSLGLGLTFLVAGIIYTFWIEVVHYYFHNKDGERFEKLRLFAYLKNNHRIHHALYNFNFGIGSNLWDILLSTKRKSH